MNGTGGTQKHVNIDWKDIYYCTTVTASNDAPFEKDYASMNHQGTSNDITSQSAARS